MPTATSYKIPPFLYFLLLAIFLRWGSFFISVIGHDESTYIVIADELLRGEVYLRDVIDTKPIGIFWIYAALIKLTGGSIPLLRLATTAVVALSSWGLYLANLRATGNRMAGYVAGVTYLLMCSVFTDYGIGPNTEHYFNCLTIWAVAVSVAAPRKRWALAGLLLGLAFIIKPFAAAEAGAVGLYLVWHYGHDVPRMLTRGLLLVGTWALPLVGVVVYYAGHELLPELWFYSVEVSAAYGIELPWYLRLKYMADYLLRYSPLLLLAAGTQVRGKFGKAQWEWLAYLLLQFVLVTVVVLLTGKRYGHYQIQLHPAVALWVGATAGVVWAAVLRRQWVRIAVVVLAVSIGLGHAAYYRGKADTDAVVAAYLRPRLRAGETYFPLNGYQITYHLLDRPVPTPYAHPSLLYLEHNRRALDIDQKTVARSIIENKSVKYLIGRRVDPSNDTELTRLLLEHFRVEGDVNGEVRVWIRE